MVKSLTLALLSRELQGSLPSRRAVDSCAEHCFLQRAVSHYCPVDGSPHAPVKSTIAAAFCPSHIELVSTTHGDHTIKVHHWRNGVLQVLQKGGHDRTPWTVAWHPTDPGLVLSGALDGKVVLWDALAGEPIQLVETGKTVAACCFHPAGDMAVYCAANRVYMWPLSAGKPWPTLPLRAYKSKHVMRMAMFNPGQPHMLLTGELVGKECSAAQLSHATPAAAKTVMRRRRTEACSRSRRSDAGLRPAIQQRHFIQQQQLDAHQLASPPQQQQQQPAMSGDLASEHIPPTLQQQGEYSGSPFAAADAGQSPKCQQLAAAGCDQRGLAELVAAVANSSSMHETAAWSSEEAQGMSSSSATAAAARNIPAAAAAIPLAVAAQHNIQQLSMLQLEGCIQTPEHHRQQHRQQQQQQQQQERQVIRQPPDMQAQLFQQHRLTSNNLGHQPLPTPPQQQIPERQGMSSQHQQQTPQWRLQQQPAEVVLGSSPTTTFFQNLGASFWLGSSRRHAGAAGAASPAAAVTGAAAPATTTAATAIDQPSTPEHVEAEPPLLHLLRELFAGATLDEETALHDDSSGSSSSNTILAACSQQPHQQQVGNEQDCHLQQQQQRADAPSASDEFKTLLVRFGQLRLSLLQVPGFNIHWGLDISGPDAQLAALCAQPQPAESGGFATPMPWPISVDCLLQINAVMGNLPQLGRSGSSSANEALQAALHSCISAGLAAIRTAWNSSGSSLCDVSPFAAVAQVMMQFEQQRQQQQQRGQQQSGDAPVVPCLAMLRVWQLQQQPGGSSSSSVPQRLSPEQQQLVLPYVVLCSERSVGISPCGRFLVAVVAVLKSVHSNHPTGGSSSSSGHTHNQHQQQQAAKLAALDPTNEEFYQLLDYELRVISLEPSTLGEVLVARAVAAAECLTCIQVSPTGEHVLVAYGKRSRQLSCLVPTAEGSFEVWHTVLQVLRMSDLGTVRQLISKKDEVNVAIWHPQPGQGICYGTKAGRVRHILACGSSAAEDAACRCRSAAAAAVGEATSVLQQALQ